MVAEHYEKFADPLALPAVYQLCYAGINVSAKESVNGNTALHLLITKPGAHKILIALFR